VNGQDYAPAVLYPQVRTPGIRWIGGWWASEVVWKQRVEEKSFASAGDRTQVVQSVVRRYNDVATPVVEEPG